MQNYLVLDHLVLGAEFLCLWCFKRIFVWWKHLPKKLCYTSCLFKYISLVPSCCRSIYFFIFFLDKDPHSL